MDKITEDLLVAVDWTVSIKDDEDNHTAVAIKNTLKAILRYLLDTEIKLATSREDKAKIKKLLDKL